MMEHITRIKAKISIYARKRTRRSVSACLRIVEEACVAIGANGNYTAVISNMLIKLGKERNN